MEPQRKLNLVKVGEIFATDRNAKIAIVSADNGFASVLDYWQARLTVHNQLVRSRTIAKAISFVCGENDEQEISNNYARYTKNFTKYG